MKTTRFTNLFSVVVTILVLGSTSFAQQTTSSGLDIESANSLIQKLEELSKQNNSDVPGSQDLLIRLGDLYTERARFHDFEAGKNNCVDCKEAHRDRNKAIATYIRALKTADGKEKLHIYFQLAQLNLSQKNQAAALGWFHKILPVGNPSEVSLARLGIADVLFAKPDFKKAAVEYNLALSNARPVDISYIYFRLAWCDLNTGRSNTALTFIIKAIQAAEKHGQITFKRDLMKDYAAVLARKDFNQADVERFISMSVPEDRDANIRILGEEAERLGNKQGSLLIWTKYAATSNDQNSKSAETSLRIAMNTFDLGDKKSTYQHLNTTVERVEKNQCENCENVRTSYRNFLVSWNKKEKTDPSRTLIEAYGLYMRIAGGDYEAMIWAAQAADMQKSYRDSAVFYTMAAETALRKGDKTSADQTLLLAIEMAEKTGDSGFKESQLKSYVSKMPAGSEIHFVQYQLALIEYKRGKYSEVASKFKTLALSKDWTEKDLRIKSADLALDSLAQTNDRAQIIAWCPLFASSFPQERLRFFDIHRRAAVNTLTDALKSNRTSETDIRKHIQTLSVAPLDGASIADKTLILKNLILTGEKLKDIEIIKKGAYGLLSLNQISANDEEFAKKSLLWVHEIELNFSEAYPLARTMKLEDLKTEQRHLKLAVLAELAGLNPTSHYEDSLKAIKSQRAANEIRLKLISLAKDKWSAFDKYARQLKSNPDMYATAGLETYLQFPDKKRLTILVRTPKISQTSDGQRLSRILQKLEGEEFISKINKMRLVKTNDRTVQKTIKERISALKQLRALYENAVKASNLSLQAVTLRALSAENSRFAKDIQALPVPRGLNKEELSLYKAMLQEQAKAYVLVSEESKELLEDFMDTHNRAITELSEAFIKGSTVDRLYAKYEFRNLRHFMSSRQTSKIENAISETRISAKDLNYAKAQVKKNPLDSTRIQRLRDLEIKRGDGPLIAFLDQRLVQIETEGRR